MWADGQTIKKPISCSAPRYVDYLLTWVPPGVHKESARRQRWLLLPWRPVEASGSGRKCIGTRPCDARVAAEADRQGAHCFACLRPHRRTAAPPHRRTAAPHRAGANFAGRRADIPDGDREALPFGLHGAHPQHLQAALPRLRPHLLLPLRAHPSRVKVPFLAAPQPDSCASQCTPDGSGRLGTPRKRPAHWAPSHCLGCSS